MAVMSWLSDIFEDVEEKVVDDVLNIEDKSTQKLLTGGKSFGKKKATSSLIDVIGEADAEVVAADQRLRKRLASQGTSSTLVSGGLGGKTARITMPTVIGV